MQLVVEYQFVECRAFGHATKRVHVEDATEYKYAERHEFVCANGCGYRRTDIVHSETGNLIERTTSYPEGYAFPGSQVNMNRAAWRAEDARRRKGKSAKLRSVS